MKEIKYLLKLQEIDREIFGMVQSKERFPKDVEDMSNLLADRKAQIEHENNKVAEFEKEKRRLENEIGVEEERIKKDKERLSQVKSNDEYHALLREIDNSRREISDRETSILKLLENADDARKAVETSKEELAKLEVEMNEKRDELNRFLQGVDQKIRDKSEEREECAKNIKSFLLRKYNMIKEKKRYQEVLARVENYSCSGCNMHVPPQMVNEIMADKQVHSCQSCERILYWGENHEKDD